MRRSSFIASLAVLGMVARKRVLSGAAVVTARSSTAQTSHRKLVAALRQGGRCHASRNASRWSGYTRADLG